MLLYLNTFYAIANEEKKCLFNGETEFKHLTAHKKKLEVCPFKSNPALV